MKIYLSGPMRGHAGLNFPKFDKGQEYLESMGHRVFSPAQQDKLRGFDFSTLKGDENLAELGFNIRETISMDLSWIAEEAEAVALLPGWERSNGARAEVFAARAVGIPVGLVEHFDEDGPYREVRP